MLQSIRENQINIVEHNLNQRIESREQPKGIQDGDAKEEIITKEDFE